MNSNLKALQLASRFALPPNSLGYCGQNTAPERFKKCINCEDCSGIEDELSKFIVLNPYLETLATITKRPKYSYKNVEAYWLGNNTLYLAKTKDYGILLDNFTKQGVPDWLTTELRSDIPKVFIPHHLFQVLFIGVGRASGSVPYNIESINNCMIRWGKVEEMSRDKAIVALHSLKIVKGKYVLYLKKEEIAFSNELTPEVKPGTTVACHWGMVVKVLNLREETALSTWTKKIITLLKPKLPE